MALLAPAERATIARVFETFAPENADGSAALTAIERKISQLSQARRSRLLALLRALAGPWLTGPLLGKPFSFDRLSPGDRERLLLSMADSPIPTLRAAFQVLKRLCLFMAYAAVDESGSNRLWQGIGYPGPRCDRKSIDCDGLVAAPSDCPPDADVVVVGSGAGGGVAAAVFARAGKRVIVLEAGPYVDASRFTQREVDMLSTLYLDAATTATKDHSIHILAGSCVGGGTIVNSCASLRLPPSIASQWSAAAGGIDFDAALAASVAQVEERLGVALPSQHNSNNAALLRGCSALGWHTGILPLNSGSCGEGCGYCSLGCAYGSKRSTASTYLRDAVDAGATVVAQARVERILMKRGNAQGVEAVIADRGSFRKVVLLAPLVAVAAGTLRTPGILQRSGLGGPHVGRHLHLHPTTGLVSIFDHPIRTWCGQMQTAYSDQFADMREVYGARLEAVPVHPGQASLAIPWRGRDQHASLTRNFERMAALVALTRDRGEGVVAPPPAGDVEYRLSPYDARHMLEALDALVDVAFAAGAQRVSTLHTKPQVLERAHASAKRRRAFRSDIFAAGAASNRLGVFSAHQMGTCRIHRDPRRGVVDEFGAVHGAKGVIVTDASVFPLASGVNPMITIMALAHRCATHHTRV